MGGTGLFRDQGRTQLLTFYIGTWGTLDCLRPGEAAVADFLYWDMGEDRTVPRPGEDAVADFPYRNMDKSDQEGLPI
jgi:hypothetical protein